MIEHENCGPIHQIFSTKQEQTERLIDSFFDEMKQLQPGTTTAERYLKYIRNLEDKVKDLTSFAEIFCR